MVIVQSAVSVKPASPGTFQNNENISDDRYTMVEGFPCSIVYKSITQQFLHDHSHSYTASFTKTFRVARTFQLMPVTTIQAEMCGNQPGKRWNQALVILLRQNSASVCTEIWKDCKICRRLSFTLSQFKKSCLWWKTLCGLSTPYKEEYFIFNVRMWWSFSWLVLMGTTCYQCCFALFPPSFFLKSTKEQTTFLLLTLLCHWAYTLKAALWTHVLTLIAP